MISNSLPENYQVPDLLKGYFSYLDLKDLLIVQKVCKLWYSFIVDFEQFWLKISLKKGIFLEKVLPKNYQAAVFASLKPYCLAARQIFPETTENIPYDE